MAGAILVVGAVSHAYKTEQNAREIFPTPFLECPPNLRNKSAYEPNLALFFAISTLIFCSLCLLFFIFFIFSWGGDYLIKIDDIL